MTEGMDGSYQDCPECRHPLPVHPGYVTWCDQCGWNLQPFAPTLGISFWDAASARLAARQGARLFAEARQSTWEKPRQSWSTPVALLVAGMVHLVTILMFALGMFLLIVTPMLHVAIFGGVVALLCAWFLRPRIPPFPATAAPRNSVRSLYEVADIVAHALDAPPVAAIVVTSRFNAGCTRAGLRRRVTITLGLPLWSILKNDERIALLAHELAHVVNGDPTRGLFFMTALDNLARWHTFWDEPRRLWRQRDLRLTYFGVPFIMLALSLVGTVICSVAYGVGFVLSRLTWREAQRAEYRADHLAVRIGGSDATLSLLEKLHFHDAFAQTVAQVTNIWSEQDLFEQLAHQVAMMPDREIERLRRRALLEPSRLDATHPPTAHRIALIKARGRSAPELRLQDDVFTMADRQLDPYRRAVQQSIVDHRNRTFN